MTDTLVNDQLLNAILMAESGGDLSAIGDTTLSNPAYGQFQIRRPAYQDVQRLYPDPYAQIPFERVQTDPDFNREVARAYLRALSENYGLTTLEALLGGYNAGPSRARAYQRSGEALPPSTVQYINTVKGYLQ